MNLRLSLIVCALILSSCNISVTSFPASPAPVADATEIPATLPPNTPTPAPPAIEAPLVESPALLEIHFFDELEGWGLTEISVIRTNDGGVTWYNVTPPDLVEVGSTVQTFFLNKDDAWVQKPDFNNFPNNGLLYHTTDGGLNWTISSTPFSGGDLSFVDNNRGWMLADLGVGAGSNAIAVFQTTDAGATWTQT